MMKRTGIAVLVAVAGLALATSAFSQKQMRWRAGNAWGPEGQYGKMYNTGTVETLTGEVLLVESFTARKGVPDGTHLMLRTDQEKVAVHLGPAWFIENQEMRIEPKERIEVTGSRIMYEGKTTIIASEVKRGEAVLTLRSEAGYPAWSGWRKAGARKGGRNGTACCQKGKGISKASHPPFNPATIETQTGTVARVIKNPAKAGDFFGIHLLLDVDGEQIEVHLGPEWYVLQGDGGLAAGDKVKVTGSRISNKGKPAILATTVVKGDNELKLRDDKGTPAWKGWRKR